ncbi:hypothetical protein Ccrd_006941 [Cynara cardunculus var. scolymus]|uniref:Uncharacterized protein n=1 Tax=Cynara cardunculus var. scolymus TaxID=59895 RepID=A0A118JTM7_CYNCS|nr:hypothetical protein Ccrd_006941 [Cynara cardunculus var. scolymus]
MSCETLMASKDAPDRPFFVNPTAYSPDLPFHPSGNGVVGIPSPENKSFSCIENTQNGTHYTKGTGVLPWVFLSSNGPINGLFIPYFSKFPRVHVARISRILSTIFTGNHFINEVANSKVDLPEISLGNT